MRRTRTTHRQRLLFHPPLNVPKWEQLQHDVRRKAVSRLATMLRRYRSVIILNEKETDDDR